MQHPHIYQTNPQSALGLKAPVKLNTGNHRQIRLLTGPLITASHLALNLCALRENALQQSVMSCYQGYFRWVTFAHSQHRNSDDFPDSLGESFWHTTNYIFIFTNLFYCHRDKLFLSVSLEFYFFIYQSPLKKTKQNDKRLTSFHFSLL